MLDDPRAQQPPGLRDLVCFALHHDRHRAIRSLVSVADLVEPILRRLLVTAKLACARIAASPPHEPLRPVFEKNGRCPGGDRFYFADDRPGPGAAGAATKRVWRIAIQSVGIG